MYIFNGGTSWGPNQRLAAIGDWIRMRCLALWHMVTFSHKWEKVGWSSLPHSVTIYHCDCGLDRYK